jgi:hypothetical protein
MKPTKTLNIDVSLHQELKIRAVGSGYQLGEFVEAVLQAGLAHPEEFRQLLEERTRLEQEQEPGK